MKNILLSCLFLLSLSTYAETIEQLVERGNKYDKLAFLELAKLLEKEPLATVQQLTPLAENGDPCAQYFLHAIYLRGMKGVNQDEGKAASLIIAASEKGFHPAVILVGDLYADGIGIPCDTAKAIECYKKATIAVPTSAYPKYRIGLLYRYGGGTVKKNPQEAAKWYLQAADLGDTNAVVDLAELYYYGEGMTKDNTRAFELYNAAADSGSSEAFGMIGYMFQNGEGIPPNYVKSFEFYKKSALLGNNNAARNLSISYSEGVGCKVDQYKAYIWAALAKALGNNDIDSEFIEDITTHLTKAQVAQAQTETTSLFASIKAGKFRTQ